MKKEDVPILNQLVNSLEENLVELEQAHANNDFDSFNKIKTIIRQLQRKIVGVVK